MSTILILLLLNIKYSQLQQLTTLFNCTFNYGLIEDCIFPALLPLGDSLQINMGEALNANAIDRPLSDATSVFSPTINGEMCQFPYEINGWDIHFCLYQEDTNDYMCPTAIGNQTCTKGQYGYKTTSDRNGFLAIYKINTIIVTNSNDEEQCLSFYYYFTDSLRDPIISFRMHPTSSTMSSEGIVIVQRNDENKWYHSQTSFTPGTDEYYLTFTLYRAQDFNDTTNFTFGLDDITVINGSCFGSTTTNNSILNETSTIAAAESTAYITKKDTTSQTIESFITTDIQQNTAIITKTSTTTSEIPSPIDDSTTATTVSVNTKTTTTKTMISTTETSFQLQTTTSKPKSIALAVGLSLGLGIPALLIMIVIFVYMMKSIIHRSKTTTVVPFSGTDQN